jgi:hypothetical protein
VYLPLRPLDGLEQFKNSPWIKHASVRRVVVELCGHARGLWILRKILEAEYSKTSEEPPYESLFHSLSTEFNGLKSIETSPQLIAACLLGVSVQCSVRPCPTVSHTYSYYISQVCICA